MVEVIFVYNEKEINFKCQIEEKMDEIIKKFAIQKSKDINSYAFTYNECKINTEITLNQLINKSDSMKKKIYIYVKSKDNLYMNTVSNDGAPKNAGANIIKTKELICPECYESTRFLIKDYKITLYDCQNRHNFKNILLNEFENTQIINKSKFLPNICREHNEFLTLYCSNCKKNLCYDCLDEHKECRLLNKLIDYSILIPNLEDIEIEIKNLKLKIDNFNDIINKYILKLNNVKNNLENYYNIINNIYQNYKTNRKRNYEILQNLNDIKINNENIIEDLEKVINEKSTYNQINKINEIYEKMNFSNEITIKYKYETNNESISIFGRCFIEHNKDICKFIYNNKEYKLQERFNIENIKKQKDNILEIKLIGINKVTNMHCIFNECTTLDSIPDINQWNTFNVTDMSNMFDKCESLSSLPDLSKWDTSNVTNFKCIFNECNSLLSLPDISTWNTSNVTNMKGMFNGCSKLVSLPDISKWDTRKVETMAEMFANCKSLIELPDISKWNLDKVSSIMKIFMNCSSLKDLPDISKWKTNKIDNMSYLFKGCLSLKKVPDISKWNTDNVNNMNSMFKECISLIIIPPINKWNFKNVKTMVDFFSKCKSLKKVPNPSKFNVTSTVQIGNIFKDVNAIYY